MKKIENQILILPIAPKTKKNQLKKIITIKIGLFLLL